MPELTDEQVAAFLTDLAMLSAKHHIRLMACSWGEALTPFTKGQICYAVERDDFVHDFLVCFECLDGKPAHPNWGTYISGEVVALEP
jgi:hypothetical protein